MVPVLYLLDKSWVSSYGSFIIGIQVACVMHVFIPFSEAEYSLLATCKQILSTNDLQLFQTLETRIQDIESLSSIVARASSVVSDLSLSPHPRTIASLSAKLIQSGIQEVVNLPVKASLGRSFVLAKLHLFGFLMKVSCLSAQYTRLLVMYQRILFSLMAEDLYISIISESDGNEQWVSHATEELIHLWEHRTAGYSEGFGVLVEQLWSARHRLIPTLGTLLGTVELLKLSFLLPEPWHDFLMQKGGEQPVVWALEEFLFSLSYEQLCFLRERMAETSRQSISREEAGSLLALRSDQMLEGPVEEQLSVVRMYRSFLHRNTLARVRRESDRPGPHRTLEQQFLLHLWSRKS